MEIALIFCVLPGVIKFIIFLAFSADYPLFTLLSPSFCLMSFPPSSDLLIEISAQEVMAEREMLFGGNLKRAGLRSSLVGLGCQRNQVTGCKHIMGWSGQRTAENQTRRSQIKSDKVCKDKDVRPHGKNV